MTNAYSQNTQSPYTGQEHRQIKALSESEISGFFAGAGMGFAKAAELNHYPGPKHVLELAEQLKLGDNQIQKAQASFDNMHEAAVPLGQQIVHAEIELDGLFSSENAAPEEIESKVNQIARLKGKLRFAHLNAHLEMRRILTSDQIKNYDQLRGYADQGNEKMHHQNQHH